MLDVYSLVKNPSLPCIFWVLLEELKGKIPYWNLGFDLIVWGLKKVRPIEKQ